MRSPGRTKPSRITEFSRWNQLSGGQKSFAVQLLHFFHYRPQRVGTSWVQEEVLTWELYRALEILPRSIFLQPFLKLCAKIGPSTATATSQLLRKPDAVQVVPYPRLDLAGNKRNRASDLGLCLVESPRIWIEAKTRLVHLATLQSQLQLQRARLRELAIPAPSAVIALVPRTQDTGTEPAVRWGQIVALLEQALQALGEHPAAEITAGLAFMARELHDRIRGHEPKLL